MKKSEQTKNKIIQSAIKLISKNGYSATTTAEIAKDAGISEATLFKYFKDKEMLLKRVINFALDEAVKNIAIAPLKENIEKNKNLKTSEFLKSIITERLAFAEKNFELLKILLIEVQYNDSIHKQVIEDLIPQMCQMINSIEKTIIKKNKVSKDVAKGLSRIVVGTIFSIVAQKYLMRVETPQDQIDYEVENVIRIIKKAIGEE